MIIRHAFPEKNWMKMDKNIAVDSSLSDGAFRLYAYLCGLRNGSDFNDNYIMKGLNVTKATLARRKRELAKFDLILIDQIRPRQYAIYIGHSTFRASKVKEAWEKDEKHNDLFSNEILITDE